MSLPRYSEYKNSGVAWLGEVPGHWEVPQSKRLFRRRKELNSGMACENRLALTMGGVVPRALDDLDGLQASEFETYQIFQKDDLAFKLIDLQNIKTSRVGIVPEMGIMSPAYIRLEANQSRLWPKFGYWYFTDLYNRQVFNQLGGGVRQTLGTEELLVLACTAPPLAEQQTIAAFLDRETGKIDALIAEQQRLVDLLAEKRQAVISHAVTKGLNPNARMKDSGIEWLGDVPAHWEVSRIKYAARIGNGSTPNRDNLDYWTDGDFPWLNSSVVNQDKITEAEQFVTRLALKECHLPIIAPPVVLVGITGQGRTRGMAATLMFEATINQHVAFVKPDECRLHIDFLRRVFDMAYQYLRTESDGTGSTKGAITCEQIARLEIPLPSLSEQKTIAAYLDTEAAKFDTLTAEANRAIALLQERRSALISAAVTGKIDVRSNALVKCANSD